MKIKSSIIIVLVIIMFMITTGFTQGCEPTKTPKPPTATKVPTSTPVPPTVVPPTDVPPTFTPVPPTDTPPKKKTKTPITFTYSTPVPTAICMDECEFRETVVDLLRRILVELQVMNMNK